IEVIGKLRKTRSKSQCGWSSNKVGHDPRRRSDEIRKDNKAVDAGQNDAYRRKSGPQYRISDVIDIAAETNEVFSTDPRHGIRTLDSGLPDFIEDAKVVSEEQFIGNVEIGLARH